MRRNDRNSSPKAPFRLPLRAYLAYLLVCTLSLTGVSFSRFVASAGGGDSARVAAGALVVTWDDPTSLEMDRPAGGEATAREEFRFSVSNGGSEVAMSYDVVVTLDQPLPDGVTMELDGRACATGGTTCTFPHTGTLEGGKWDTQSHTLAFVGDYEAIGEPSQREIVLSVRAWQLD